MTSKKDQEQYWANKAKPYRYIPVSEFAQRFKQFHVGLQLENELSVPFEKDRSHRAALVFSRNSVSTSELLKASFAKEWLLIKRNSFVYIFKTVQVRWQFCILPVIHWYESCVRWLGPKYHQTSLVGWPSNTLCTTAKQIRASNSQYQKRIPLMEQRERKEYLAAEAALFHQTSKISVFCTSSEKHVYSIFPLIQPFLSGQNGEGIQHKATYLRLEQALSRSLSKI